MRWLDGITDSMDIEFEQPLGVDDGLGSLAFCSPCGRKELDMTERLNCLTGKYWTLRYITHLIISLINYGEGNSTSLQYSCLENPMDRGAWWAAVHGVTKSQTQLNDFTFTFHFHALEKEMETHSSVLARRIPGTGEPGGLTSMGSHRVGHD